VPGFVSGEPDTKDPSEEVCEVRGGRKLEQPAVGGLFIFVVGTYGLCAVKLVGQVGGLRTVRLADCRDRYHAISRWPIGDPPENFIQAGGATGIPCSRSLDNGHSTLPQHSAGVQIALLLTTARDPCAPPKNAL
jgi:hypothetical protein